MTNVQGKRFAVVGMAKSGIAAVELLRRHGAEVRAIDQKPEKVGDIGGPVLPQTDESFRGVDVVVLSPGVPIDAPEVLTARQAGTRVIGEVELASWFLRGPIIGITGSNGKTTTTAMIGHILRESGIPVQVGGNIGTAPTSMIDCSRDDQWNVLELSSFQLETIDTFKAKIGVCTNVTPNHLNRHHTFENYSDAKARLFETEDADCAAVLNADNPTTVSYAARTRATAFWFSSTHAVAPGIYFDRGQLIWDGKPWIAASEIPLVGMHNVENAMTAAIAARLAGATPDQIAAAIRTFTAVEHRIEFVLERNGVKYYNDSKATSVDATMKAIDSFSGGLWVILGGLDKGSPYTPLRESLREKGRGVLLIGAAAGKIQSELDGAVPISQCGTLDKAVAFAAAHAKPGDTVLLAPACASFDQFNSFEQRGTVFKELVRGL